MVATGRLQYTRLPLEISQDKSSKSVEAIRGHSTASTDHEIDVARRAVGRVMWYYVGAVLGRVVMQADRLNTLGRTT